MRSGECILVFGVSGVGKTAACEALVQRQPDFLYLRASSVLSDLLSSSAESLRTAGASEIQRNQYLLSEEIWRRRSMHLDRPAIIDVHAIIDNDSGFVQVPLDAIAALRPDGLVLLEAPPEVVSERRRSDHRTRPARADLQIDRELLAERERVAQFSEDLRVPLETAQVIPSFRLEETIAALRQRIRVAAPC